jgi:hypothetical protein
MGNVTTIRTGRHFLKDEDFINIVIVKKIISKKVFQFFFINWFLFLKPKSK